MKGRAEGVSDGKNGVKESHSALSLSLSWVREWVKEEWRESGK